LYPFVAAFFTLMRNRSLNMNKSSFTEAVIVLCVLILSGCTTRDEPPAEVIYSKKASPYHVVKEGESIASIARTYHMDMEHLVTLNNLKAPYFLVVGQRLLVAPTTGEAEYHAPAQSGLPPETAEPAFAQDGSGQVLGAEKEEILPNTLPSSDTKLKPPPSGGRFLWPLRGKIIREFNPGAGNDGINIAAARWTPVKAANNGVVAHTGNQIPGFGNVVLIKHANNIMTVYAHLDEIEAGIEKGKVVYAGQPIGKAGNSGNAQVTQLHFEVRNGTTPQDPKQFLGP
jgi:lipoprotein NlpD